MAKKVVATIQKGAGKSFTKVIRAKKNTKTGSYSFQTEMVHNDLLKEATAKK